MKIVHFAFALAALAIGRTVIRSYYYVTDYAGAVSIMQGIQVSILGVPLHQPYSQGCLNSRNQLSVIRYGQAGGNCQPMKLSDLAPSARAQVAAGLPAGTLEQADSQLRRLSTESLLPPCPPARAQSPPTSTPQTPPTTSPSPEPGASYPEQPPVSPSPTPAAPTRTMAMIARPFLNLWMPWGTTSPATSRPSAARPCAGSTSTI